MVLVIVLIILFHILVSHTLETLARRIQTKLGIFVGILFKFAMIKRYNLLAVV